MLSPFDIARLKAKGHKFINVVDCCNIITWYIEEKKGVTIRVMPPRTEKEIELFESALSTACSHFGTRF